MFVQFAYGKQSPSHLPPCFACVRRAKLSETEFNFCCFRENCCPVVGSCFCSVWKMCFCCFCICFLRIEQLKASPGSSRSPFSSSPSTKVFIASHFLCVHSNKFHLRNCFQNGNQFSKVFLYLIFPTTAGRISPVDDAICDPSEDNSVERKRFASIPRLSPRKSISN